MHTHTKWEKGKTNARIIFNIAAIQSKKNFRELDMYSPEFREELKKCGYDGNVKPKIFLFALMGWNRNRSENTKSPSRDLFRWVPFEQIHPV